MSNNLNIFQEVDLSGIEGAGFATGTDSLKASADRQIAIQGAGWNPGTDALDNIFYYIDTINTGKITPAQVNAEVDTALNTAIPGSPAANSINEILRNAGLGELMLPAGIYPTDDLVHSNDIEITGITDDVYTKKKEIVCSVNGVIRVKFDHKQSAGITTFSRIYKNKVEFGTEQSTTSLTYVTETEDLLFAAGDTIELRMKRSTPSGAMAVQNFRLYGIVVTKMTNSVTG